MGFFITGNLADAVFIVGDRYHLISSAGGMWIERFGFGIEWHSVWTTVLVGSRVLAQWRAPVKKLDGLLNEFEDSHLRV